VRLAYEFKLDLGHNAASGQQAAKAENSHIEEDQHGNDQALLSSQIFEDWHALNERSPRQFIFLFLNSRAALPEIVEHGASNGALNFGWCEV